MTGYIKITATTHNGHQGLEVETDVQNVSILDRMQVLDSLCRGFKFSLNELKLFMSLKSAGFFDKVAKVETIQDEQVKGPGADLFDQLMRALMGGDDK